MKPCFHVFLLAFTLLTVTACANVNSQTTTPSPIPRGPEIRGVFGGTTPCSAQTRPLPQIPADTDCEQMIWSLVLYQDPQTGTPTTYSLKSAYGLPKQGTNDLVGGGTSISMEGKWTITKGIKADPGATVYQINPNDSQRTISFLKVSDDLLHVLNSEKALLVGNGAWSYTLNRMEDQNTTQLNELSGSPPEPPTRPPMPPIPEGSSVFGVFDGRTPCHAVVLAFTKTAPFPGCLKIKWRLTLYQDNATGAPSTYLYMGTSKYREGSWRILHGSGNDAVVYQLDLDDSGQLVSFLKVDENHLFLLDQGMNLLVGNALFSYTLSRTDQGTQ